MTCRSQSMILKPSRMCWPSYRDGCHPAPSLPQPPCSSRALTPPVGPQPYPILPPVSNPSGRRGWVRRHESFEMRLDSGPFIVGDAEVDAVPDAPTGHDHMIAKGAFLGGANAGQGLARFSVERVGLELYPNAAQGRA